MNTGIFRYIVRTVMRSRLRTVFTLLGIATAMFLFCFIEGLQKGVREATEGTAAANRLIVYQKSRFCPATSNLPERYDSAIREIAGVKSVLPVKIYVNNCRASLDSVTFRGVPPADLESAHGGIVLKAGEYSVLEDRFDAAILGARLAARRGLKVGDRFQIGGISVGVQGVFESSVPGDDNTAYVGLRFLQQARGGIQGLGRVTQFEVLIDNPEDADRIITAIDERFRTDEVQTTTKSHKAHIQSATGDLLGIIGFTRFLGLLCVGLVLALTANTVYVMANERIREHAVLQTLGFTGPQLFGMIVAESVLLATVGGVLGTGLAAAALEFGNLSLGAEGVQVSFMLSWQVLVAGLAASVLTGLLAGVVPALQSSRAPITDSLRRA